ncbi:unnamed protein product, partial [Brenthis ino]
MQWILTGLVTFSCSVKTYQVNRINESSYLVTSLPDFEHAKKFDKKANGNRIVPINNDKRSFTINDYYDSTPSTVNVGEKKENLKVTIPASFIKNARDQYFRNYYPTMKTSNSLYSPEVNSYSELAPLKKCKPLQSRHNLNIARYLASRLIMGEQDELGQDNKIIRNKRRTKSQRFTRHAILK